MLTIETLDVTSYDITSLTATWTIKPTSESLTDYVIDVYRSESPGAVGSSLTGFDLIASGINATTYSYTDTGVSGLYDPLRTWYYKLNVKNNVSLTTLVQPSTPAYRKATSTDRF